MKIKPILPLFVIVFGLFVPASAQPRSLREMNTPALSSCDDLDAKAKLYQKFLYNYKGTVEQQKVAYETGKEYIAKYGDCPDEADKKVAAYIRMWMAKYEKAVREPYRRVY